MSALSPVACLAFVLCLMGSAHAQSPTIVTNTGQSSYVKSVVFSPDQRWIAAAGADGTIRLWDATSSRLLRSLVGHAKEVNAVAISPDGRTVVSVSDDGTAKLWEAATGSLLRTITTIPAGEIGSVFAPNGIAFTSDGRSLLTFTHESIQKWDTTSGALQQTFTKPRPTVWATATGVEAFALSSDGRKIAEASYGSRPNLSLYRKVRIISAIDAKVILQFDAHTESIVRVSFSPDGRSLATISRDGTAKVWDAATGRLVRTLALATELPQDIAWSPDSRYIATAAKDIKLWDVSTGNIAATLEGIWAWSIAFAPDGRSIAIGSSSKIAIADVSDGSLKLRITNEVAHPATGQVAGPVYVAEAPDHHWLVSDRAGLRIWDSGAWNVRRILVDGGMEPELLRFPTAGKSTVEGGIVHALAFRWSGGRTAEVWDGSDGKLLQSFAWGAKPPGERPCATCSEYHLNNVTISPNGAVLAATLYGDGTTIKVWDVRSGRLLRDLPGPPRNGNGEYAAYALALSSDGRTLVSTHFESLKVWEIESGKLIKSTTLSRESGLKGFKIAISPDGRWLAIDQTILKRAQYDMLLPDIQTIGLIGRASLKPVRTFRAGTLQNNPGGGTDANVMVFSPNGSWIAVGTEVGLINIWDVETGQLVHSLKQNPGTSVSLAFSSNSRQIVSGNANGTSALWDTQTGQQLVTTLHDSSGEWITITPEGFFSASSPRAGVSLSAVVGLKSFTIDQIYQAMFNPDLVRAKLAGDRDGEVKKSAAVLDLAKVLDSGQVPLAAIVSPEASGGTSAEETITARARVTNQGGGIGRIEWRVNDITVAVAAKPEGSGPEFLVSQQLALDPGDNTIEVIAYNEKNLLASRPARTTIKFSGSGFAQLVKPTLHVLAIGINAYKDAGWTPPGQSETLAFPPLALAVKDAIAFGDSLKRAAGGLYADIRLTTLTDAQATRENVRAAIDKIAAEVQPRDTFVLFAAAHGKSEGARFYLIPQDYDGGPDPEALAGRAIDQVMLQDWLANRIKAKKAVVLLDTCESGALVGGHTRSRTDAPASEAALGRLHEATGRPVLTAAAEGNPAFEGYEGHGVFTWALLDALKNGDRNGNGTIELSELVAHVQDQVPRIAAKLNGIGRAAIALRGAAEGSQSARFGSKGEDFALAARLQ